MLENILIKPYEINLLANSIKIEIHDYKFEAYITLKILLFDSDNNYIISYFVNIEGDDYINMISSTNSDEFIKMYITTKLGIIFNIV